MAKNWYSTPGFRECGNSWFDAGFRKVAKKVLTALKGGEYAQRQEERINKTLEGQKLLKSLKTKGFIKTLLGR